MKLRGAVVTGLAAILVTACASSRPASAPERADQAERDKARAEEDARKARIDSAEARQNAADADRARYEADQRARYAAAEAAQAERDARQAQWTGVAEPQRSDARLVQSPYPRVVFAASSADLADSERATLDEIVSSLRAHPSQTVVIHTYADDTGDHAKDEKLAQRRADAVAHYFESRGVSGDRITTKIVTREVAYGDVPDDERRGPYRRVVIIMK
jgi:outer membrane protein OmpA-like peptidoglycan-associated protein